MREIGQRIFQSEIEREADWPGIVLLIPDDAARLGNSEVA
jgi:hypothetical protein